MAEFPAMPLWTDAYLADTSHLTTLEHGAYFLLLVVTWRTHDKRLPDDDKKLARYARLTPGQWARIKPTMREFFKVENGFWTQGRLTDEANAVKQYRERQAAAGKASALKRKGRHSTTVELGCNQTATPTPTPTPTPSIPPEGGIIGGRKKSSTLPDYWHPANFDPQSKSAHIISGWTPEEYQTALEHFVQHHRSKGSKFVDWQSAWGTWVLNSAKYKGHSNGKANRTGSNIQRGSSGDGFTAVLREVGSRDDAFQASGNDGGMQQAPRIGFSPSGRD